METDANLSAGAICKPGGVFVNYVEQVYRNDEEQLVFVLLEGSIGTMLEARECLRSLPLWVDEELKIGRVIADEEFQKSVLSRRNPAYIREYAGNRK